MTAAAATAAGSAGPRMAGGPAAPAARIVALGRRDYVDCWRAMQSFTASRDARTADELWITEHEPVYTLGLAGRPEHLLRPSSIPVHKVDRGGQVTYHGPGQLVVYTLVDLRRLRLGVRALVRLLEDAVCEWLAGHGIDAHGSVTAPGVYVDAPGGARKIAALGLKVRNGCTYHGLSVNVAMDLSPWADIDPCGYPGLAVAQLADFGVARTVDEAGSELAPVVGRRLAAAARVD